MPDADLILKFSEPVTDIRFHDTSTLQANAAIQYNELVFEQTDEYGMAFRLAKTLNDTTQYTLNLLDSIFYSVCGHTNEAINLKFRRAKESDLGKIMIQVIPQENTQVVVQLLNSKDKVLGSQVIDTIQKICFNQLFPDKYKLKAIVDRDKDGQWSSGNYHQRFLPETVLEYKEILEVTAGWDIDLEAPWKLY